jgi:prepilin-type N-terminal cleavage/methylation domain-containing protein
MQLTRVFGGLNISHRPWRRGFTLVELLIVIGVILLLAAILLPTINRASDQARGVRCQSNLRQLWQGFLLFAADHDRHLPGGYDDGYQAQRRGGAYAYQWDWVGVNNNLNTYSLTPKNGTIFRYVGDTQVYRCPALEVAAPDTPNGSIYASRGHFDYTVFTAWAGAKLEHIPQMAVLQDGNSQSTLPTPIICEEVGTTSGTHCGNNQMGHQHWGGSFYVSPDGAVQWYAEPWEVSASNWNVICKHGGLFSIGGGPTPVIFQWGVFDLWYVAM